MLDVIASALRVAITKAGVLIQGEPGTGKALLARFLHERGGRAGQPFVAVNCATLPTEETWAGAFEQAFEEADGGTLFLNEVAAMSAVAQARVYRILEDRALERGDAEPPLPVDVRIVAATERDLRDEVVRGRFRADLYYRLGVIVLTLPPLRERGDDVRMLAEHFVGNFACANGRSTFAIANETLSLLRTHPWPGNVRQLKDTVEQATSNAVGPLLELTDLPAETRSAPPPAIPGVATGGSEVDILPLNVVERRYLERVVTLAGGNLGRAARLLGIDPFTLQRKLREHSVH